MKLKDLLEVLDVNTLVLRNSESEYLGELPSNSDVLKAIEDREVVKVKDSDMKSKLIVYTR